MCRKITDTDLTLDGCPRDVIDSRHSMYPVGDDLLLPCTGVVGGGVCVRCAVCVCVARMTHIPTTIIT